MGGRRARTIIVDSVAKNRLSLGATFNKAGFLEGKRLTTIAIYIYIYIYILKHRNYLIVNFVRCQ